MMNLMLFHKSLDINPIDTICIAISFDIPNKLVATGISNSDPPVTPEALQADSADNILSIKAVNKSMCIPKVFTAAKVRTDIVIATTAILVV